MYVIEALLRDKVDLFAQGYVAHSLNIVVIVGNEVFASILKDVLFDSLKSRGSRMARKRFE